MNHADALLVGILEQPNDPARWLVTSDWLEEQGDSDNLVRAQLFRLQARCVGTNPARRRNPDRRAAEILAEHPELFGSLKPLLDQSFPVLSAPSALAMFLLADQTTVVEEPFTAGTTWVGELSSKAVLHFITPSRRFCGCGSVRATNLRGT